MCIRTEAAPAALILPWDPSRHVITVPQGVPPEAALIGVRAVLTELAIPQPSAGARCWCGAAVELPRVPNRQEDEVIHRAS
ncbi:hypothetical protein [Streptomyces jumonjinensis]|uniref:Uncharacterized protein n=1 Tax=Streptomyces jumonjinensis TaxID=1945 RepID=A0A646KQ37_STRJU|nr:hypothetical protein [Streptomyces jumonjinensis]MQT03116.1 hypothetical protein [Streptomyces jumonjinensis]